MTTGSYQYIDANGLLQTVNYVADPVNGFRVAGTNIPVGPAAAEVEPLIAPTFNPEPLVAPGEFFFYLGLFVQLRIIQF